MEYIKGTPDGNAYEDGLLQGRIDGMQQIITLIELQIASLEKQQQRESKKKNSR